jgi:ABC-type transport system substrate-binding protein
MVQALRAAAEAAAVAPARPEGSATTAGLPRPRATETAIVGVGPAIPAESPITPSPVAVGLPQRQPGNLKWVLVAVGVVGVVAVIGAVIGLAVLGGLLTGKLGGGGVAVGPTATPRPSATAVSVTPEATEAPIAQTGQTTEARPTATEAATATPTVQAPTATSAPTPTQPPTPTPPPQPTPTAISSLPGTETVPLSNLASSIPWLPLDKNAVPGTFYYGFNVNKPPFDNRLVRQAFAAAIDRQAIANLANSFGAKNARPATAFTPPETLGRDLYGEVGLPFDPAQARALLAEAGYPDGQGFPSVTLVTNRGGGGTSGANAQIADAVASMWHENLKVDVKVEIADDWQAYLDLLARDTPAIYRLGWAADVNDPDNFLNTVFHSQSEGNYGHFADAEFDRLVEQGAALSDPATRQALYIQAERILCQDQAAIVPLYHATYQSP